MDEEEKQSFSLNYDKRRKTNCLKIFISIFDQYESPQVLDLGCGTGAYLMDLSNYYNTAVGVDPDKHMLARFREKLNKEPTMQKKVELIEARAQDITMLQNSRFDIAMTCLTLHHLKSKQECIDLFKQAYRVLKPGGVFLVNHVHREQVDCYWFLLFCERVREICKQLFDSIEEVCSYGRKTKLQVQQIIPCYESAADKSPEFVLTEEGRKSWNIFELFERKEVVALEKEVRLLMKNGMMDQWMRENVSERLSKYGYESVFKFKRK